MNTVLIDRCLSRDPVVRRHYRGCFAVNSLPLTFSSFPICMVINEDRTDEPGSHWVCMFVRSPSSVDYFDSLAREPVLEMATYLEQFEHVVMSPKPLQSSVSSVCGQFTLFVLLRLCQGQQLDRIVDDLMKLKSRDRFVQEFVNRRYGLDLPLFKL